ncbi:serine protease [Altererythrobacter sp. GH1-8]|uniref:S1 family peptidase n=1 Tax=Altererythrobacter sp. GH1-8 TaxID=3349333 RepID=UPI00374DED50
MGKILTLIAAIAALLVPLTAKADPADIDAAARGVVRVVIIGSNGEEVYPVSHGSGFAVTPTTIVTNAHVIREALQDDTLRIGIVPSDGAEAAYGKPVAVSPRNDLALIELTDGSLRLPPLTLAAGASSDLGEVSAVGYPMNVDRAQGLDIGDIFKSQPAVKSRGFLSGARPSRQFDTILHTAPIARGNSGGPLLDPCGRVVGVNSFGADSDGSDAEFYFAVSLRELLPFLRENNVEVSPSGSACRSLAEVDLAERYRLEQQRAEARERLAAREAELREARTRAQLEAQLEVMGTRDNLMALSMLLLLLAIGAGFIGLRYRESSESPAPMRIAFGVAAVALAGTIVAWLMRPGIDRIDELIAIKLNQTTPDQPDAPPQQVGDGTLLCTLVPERSRVTGARTDDVEFDWAADGCVNGRTQYGQLNGEWSRVLVPDDQDAVAINRYDPETQTFRTDRYLLSREALDSVREARDSYQPPLCGVTDAAQVLGDQQQALTSMLPSQPNERLVYSCAPRENVPATPLAAEK